MTNAQHTRADPVDQFVCQRTDNKNLIDDWTQDKRQKNLKSAYVQTTGGLLDIDNSRTEYALGESNHYVK